MEPVKSRPFAGRSGGVFLDKPARREESFGQRAIGFVIDLVSVEGAIAVALGDARGGKAALFALHFLALAGAGDP